MGWIARTWILLALLSLACRGADSGPAADAVAGKVVELDGTVEAVRGQAEERRSLTIDAPIYGDDTIITAEGASVVILLEHNQARWTLEGGKRRTVRDSAAWSAPRREGGSMLAGQQQDLTTAAGRHAEREAADTRATAPGAPAADEDEAPAAAAEMAAEPAPPPRPAAPAPDRQEEEARLRAAAERAAQEQRMAEEQARAQVEEQRAREREARAKRAPAKTGAPPPPPAGGGMTGVGPGGGGTSEQGLGGIGTSGKGGGGSGYGAGSGSSKQDSAVARVTVGATTVSGAIEKAVVERVIKRSLAQLRYCYERELTRQPDLKGALVVKFVVDAEGAVPTASIDGGDGKLASGVGSCVVDRIRRMRFPKPESGIVTVRQALDFAR